MPTSRSNRIMARSLAAAAMMCAGACAMAQASPAAGNPNGPGPMPSSGAVRLTNEATSTTGTIIHRDLEWKSKIPLDKTYAEFSPAEKATLHAMYESMPPGDEPPFPVDGMRPVFDSIRKGQQIVRSRGKLNLVVTVGADGTATEVANLGGVGGVNALEITQYAESVLLMTRFKPAVCGGRPCKSQFPFHLDLKMR
jgi:hypothetical protein